MKYYMRKSFGKCWLVVVMGKFLDAQEYQYAWHLKRMRLIKKGEI